MNDSVIIKTDENIPNNIYAQIEMNNIKNPPNKSFIPLINTLKFKKDKEENATPSYLLALGINDNNNKNDYYIQKGNIIEEEKSEMLISESDLSNKKIITKKNNFLTIREQLNLNYKKELNSRFNEEIKFDEENKKKIFITVNKIKKKNNEKELKKREIISNNKKNLLSIFFTLTKNKKENYKKIEKKNISIEKPKNRRTYSHGNSFINSLKVKNDSIRKLNTDRIKYLDKKYKTRTNSNINIIRKTHQISKLNYKGNNSFSLIPFSNQKNLSFKIIKKKKINYKK